MNCSKNDDYDTGMQFIVCFVIQNQHTTSHECNVHKIFYQTLRLI